MQKKHLGSFPRTIAAFLLCLPLLSLFACASTPQSGVFLPEPVENPYTQAIESFLPDYEVKMLLEGIFTYLESGAVTGCYEHNAYSALKTGVAEYWYPQYLATAVIAVDRDRTACTIKGWRDLTEISEAVAFYEGRYDVSLSLLLCAMSYGLEGEGYTLESASSLLYGINSAGRLKLDSFDSPVIICFDDQAARLISEGRNLEVIVPAEGTFSYLKGLLSTSALAFTGDVEQGLLGAGLRLADGRCDQTLYPATAAYAAADRISDMDHFLSTELETSRTLRRDVRHVRLYTGADGRDHQILALIYVAVMFIWTASVVQRAVQKSVRRGAISACAILLSWITVRMVKYQTDSLIIWDRFLWFSFLGFQLMLMFTLLVMAWNIDIKPGRKRMPKWLWGAGVLNVLLALVVFTNDLHGLVYSIDYSNPLWRSDYGYAIGYFIATGLSMAEFITANILLLTKSIRNPSKKALILPLALCVLIFVYHLGYIARIPLMWESDMTMITGVFVLMFFESAIRVGMIPVNTKYATVFSHSTLRMQLLGHDGSLALSSISATALDLRSRDHILSGDSQPLLHNENTLLYSKAITGGYVAWLEDISGLNRLHQETEESVYRLNTANNLLAEEEKIKRQLGEEAVKRQLAEQLEEEIAGRTAQLTRMIDELDTCENQAQGAAKIALLLCYIKRRCNLFFRERETERLATGEIAAYIDELAELAEHANVKISPAGRPSGALPAREATLFYDFFYEIVAWAAEKGCTTMLRHLGVEPSAVMMRLMPSADVRDCRLGEGLETAIRAAGGSLLIKDLDDAIGITLSFPSGGDMNA